MIRPYTPDDVEEVLRVFRASCYPSHAFLPAGFNERAGEEMRKGGLVRGDVRVVDEEGIRAFIVLVRDYVEALFVDPEYQSCGYGKALLDDAKAPRALLRLGVFAENARAIGFYQREGFYAEKVGTHAPTKASYVWLKWERGVTWPAP